LELIAQNFRCLATFSALRLSKILWCGVLGWQAVQLGTIAMDDLILVLSIFSAGIGCGYYLRDRISRYAPFELTLGTEARIVGRVAHRFTRYL
jgi:hypothetical protein